MKLKEKVRRLPKWQRELLGLAVLVLPVLYFYALPGLSTWAKVLVGLASCGFIGFSMYMLVAMITHNVGQRNARVGFFTLFTFGLLSLYTVILSH